MFFQKVCLMLLVMEPRRLHLQRLRHLGKEWRGLARLRF